MVLNPLLVHQEIDGSLEGLSSRSIAVYYYVVNPQTEHERYRSLAA